MTMRNMQFIKEISEKYDSFYLYDEESIIERTEKLKIAFPAIEFLYSIKCNHNPNVVKSVFSQGFGADAASAGEVQIAVAAGLKKENIFYSAPGKSMKDIEDTIDRAVLIADSINEIVRIQKVAKNKGCIVNIGLRINPEFSFYGENGMPSKFGIDEADAIRYLETNNCANVKVTGIHVHLRSQELNADVLARYYDNILKLAKRIQAVTLEPLQFINMGSGMGIQYNKSDVPLDIELLAEKVNEILGEFHNSCPNVRLIVETGRFVTGKAGIYVTTVADRKQSHGKTYIILNNTLNGFIRPSLARLIAHYSSEQSPKGSEPLFTDVDAFPFITLKDGGGMEQVDLVGNLCTATDVIAENVWMPILDCGDVIAITNAGAYAAVLSPMQFSSQKRPAELFLMSDGTIVE